MGFFKKLLRVVAPVLGGFFGGPIGAFLGGGIGATLGSRGNFGKQFLTGGLLGWSGAKLGGMLHSSLGSSLGQTLGVAMMQAIGAGGMSFWGHSMIGGRSGSRMQGLPQLTYQSPGMDFGKMFQDYYIPTARKEAQRELAKKDVLYAHQPATIRRDFSQYEGDRRKDPGFRDFGGQDPIRMRYRGRKRRDD